MSEQTITHDIHCGRCTTCCIEPLIPLNDDDVRQIVAATGMPVEKFVRFVGPDDVDWPEDADEWIRLRTGLRLMVLRQIDDRCYFLGREGCLIYPHRPKICRVFPVDFTFDDELNIVAVERQARIGRCTARTPARPEWSEELVQTGRELYAADQAYQEQVIRWNREARPAGPQEFLAFLGLA